MNLLYMSGSRNFRQGGPGQSDKKALTTFFFSLQKSTGQFQRNLSFLRFQRGSTFSRGGDPTFSRGVGGPNAYSL